MVRRQTPVQLRWIGMVADSDSSRPVASNIAAEQSSISLTMMEVEARIIRLESHSAMAVSALRTISRVTGSTRGLVTAFMTRVPRRHG